MRKKLRFLSIYLGILFFFYIKVATNFFIIIIPFVSSCVLLSFDTAVLSNYFKSKSNFVHRNRIKRLTNIPFIDLL